MEQLVDLAVGQPVTHLQVGDQQDLPGDWAVGLAGGGVGLVLGRHLVDGELNKSLGVSAGAT